MPVPISCGKVTPGIGPVHTESEAPAKGEPEARRDPAVTARVGRPAPDFKAEAYHEGTFKLFQLSEFQGKWVVLCFYPGDFTFV